MVARVNGGDAKDRLLLGSGQGSGCDAGHGDMRALDAAPVKGRRWSGRVARGRERPVNLAIAYDEGQGVPKDEAQAVVWYRRAAEQGHASAQFSLGLMYAEGRGVAKDLVQAFMWYGLAAAGGVTVRDRDTLARQMTPQQIAEAQRLSREWKPKEEVLQPKP